MSPQAAFTSAHGTKGFNTINGKVDSDKLRRRRCGSAIDLVHLSRQSLGDRALETEILNLFRSQSRLYMERLMNASTAAERRLAAHTILGSARGIGAWQVADCAEPVCEGLGSEEATENLKNSVSQANAYIDEILAR